VKKYDSISSHDDFANNYDLLVKEYESYAHDIIFGMCYEFIKPGFTLLDIGIGTGLASENFAKTGMKIYGLDGSKKMIKVCEAKSFALELKIHDITKLPFPYDKGYFDFIISCGVFHFFGELENIIKEVKRLIKKDGIFSFTYANQDEFSPNNESFIELATPWGVSIFKQNSLYVESVLKSHRFEILKKQKVLLKGSEKEDIEFIVLVTKSV